MTKHILFICPHGAAKSVMAAAYFRELSRQHGLTWTANAAGTEPDAAIAPHVAALLQREGLESSGYTPRHVTADELAQADRVISLGCSDDELGGSAGRVEHWNDVTPPSQNLEGARDIIRAHIRQLITELQDA